MGGKFLPKKWSEVSFKYVDDALPLVNGKKYGFQMTILTGFVGMSVDEQGFIRPQIGWSIHCKNSSDEAKALKNMKTKMK